MWGLTCYKHNPNSQYGLFRDSIKSQKLPLLTVELAIGDAPFMLSSPRDAEILVQVRTQTVPYQKERLLNIGLSRLPQQCKKVCWMDSEIIYKNPKWVEKTSELLEKYLLVFPYRSVKYMDNSGKIVMTRQSFGSYCVDNPTISMLKESEYRMGIWGFSCAMRVEMLRKMGGFYDANIVGTLICKSYTDIGIDDGILISYMFGYDVPDINDYTKAHYKHLMNYLKKCENFHIKPHHVGCTNGEIIYLSLPTKQQRQPQYEILKKLSYNPEKDLEQNADGCYEFKTEKMRKGLSECSFIY